MLKVCHNSLAKISSGKCDARFYTHADGDKYDAFVGKYESDDFEQESDGGESDAEGLELDRDDLECVSAGVEHDLDKLKSQPNEVEQDPSNPEWDAAGDNLDRTDDEVQPAGSQCVRDKVQLVPEKFQEDPFTDKYDPVMVEQDAGGSDWLWDKLEQYLNRLEHDPDAGESTRAMSSGSRESSSPMLESSSLAQFGTNRSWIKLSVTWENLITLVGPAGSSVVLRLRSGSLRQYADTLSSLRHGSLFLVRTVSHTALTVRGESEATLRTPLPYQASSL